MISLRLCWMISLYGFTLTASAQRPRLDVAPKTPPSSCGIALMTIATVAGSPAYVRLRFQIDALSSAQEGVTTMAAAQEEFKRETNSPAVSMSSLFTGFGEAYDNLLCAASITDRYKPTDPDDKTAKALLIVAFNQEAEALADLQTHVKEQLVRPAQENTTATQLKDAERITAMNRLQKEAVETLSQVAVFSLMEAVDLSDPTAKDTAKTLLSCTEFDDLRKRSTEISHSAKSGYSDTAGLFVTFFKSHQCNR
jgi:hypothetical protein